MTSSGWTFQGGRWDSKNPIISVYYNDYAMFCYILYSIFFWKEVDVVVDRIPFLNYYRDVIDFSVPLAHDNWVTLQRQSDDSVSMAGLSSPFQLTVITRLFYSSS